jgi:hypothetical protein
VTKRKRGIKEERARKAARLRQKNGDPLPYMAILRQERDRLEIDPVLERTHSNVETVRSHLL